MRPVAAILALMLPTLAACTDDPASSAPTSSRALPPGQLVVQVVPAIPNFGPMRGAGAVVIGDRKVEIRAKAGEPLPPATFDALAPGATIEPTLTGPFLSKPLTMTVPTDRGLRVELPALQLDAHRGPPVLTDVRKSELHVSFVGEKLELRWERSGALMARADVTRPVDQAKEPELTDRASAMWKAVGLGPDRKAEERDLALIHASPPVSFDELVSVARALGTAEKGSALFVAIVTSPRTPRDVRHSDGSEARDPAELEKARQAGQGLGGGGRYKARPARARIGEITSTGPLATDAIRPVVEAKLPEVLRCYDGGLRKNPALEGRASVAFTIGLDGYPGDPENAGSDLLNTEVLRCIEHVLASTVFPSGDKWTNVVVPIALSPD